MDIYGHSKGIYRLSVECECSKSVTENEVYNNIDRMVKEC